MNRPALQESLEQYLAFLDSFARLKASSEVLDLPGMRVFFADVTWPLMNAAFITEPPGGEAEWVQRIGQAREYFRRRKRASVLLVCEEWAAGVGQAVMARHAMAPLMAVTGMVAEQLEPPPRPAPEELDYQRIEDRAGRFALVHINSTSYAVPSEWGREVAENSEQVWVGSSFAHLGFAGGKPVTVSTTVRMGDALYVGWVATLPQYRRRGYAEAVMRHSLAEASRVHGLTRSALHATPAGLAMYQRMGYRPVGRFIIYGLTDA